MRGRRRGDVQVVKVSAPEAGAPHHAARRHLRAPARSASRRSPPLTQLARSHSCCGVSLGAARPCRGVGEGAAALAVVRPGCHIYGAAWLPAAAAPPNITPTPTAPAAAHHEFFVLPDPYCYQCVTHTTPTPTAPAAAHHEFLV